MKIIGKKDNLFLVVDDDKLTMSNIYDNAYVVNSDGVRVSPTLKIGVLTKDGLWENVNIDYNKYIYENNDYVKDALIGAAVGDAYGVPYEFMSRDGIAILELEDMIGSDIPHTFNSFWGVRIPSGSWSDDTSMIIATMNSIIEKGNIDYDDIMKKFLVWRNNGKYSANGYSFGEGSTVAKALDKYVNGYPPLDCGCSNITDNGNGSLMRILPFSLFCIAKNMTDDEIYKIISNGSSITHAHEISIMACFMYTKMLLGAIKTRNVNLAFKEMCNTKYNKYFKEETINEFSDILKNVFKLKPSNIEETGYVVDSLKVVVYSLLTSTSYSSTIKKCIKLGYDTDTNACIAGSIAGVIYGYNNIPKNWLSHLKKKDYLESLATKYEYVIDKINLNNNYIIDKYNYDLGGFDEKRR